MKLIDLTLPTIAENLALDEALLESAECSGEPGEVLRIWESPSTAVVIGRSSRIDQEVNRPGCRRRGIPVFRRTSGGAAVVIGPGCLMYAVVLSYELRPHLRSIDNAHRFVLDTNVDSLRSLSENVQRQGISDLTLGDRKFSGNSLRCKRDHLLYHGTLLYDFPLEVITTCLNLPPRQPDYRDGRKHESFVTCLSASVDDCRRALISAWKPSGVEDNLPTERITELVMKKYSNPEWNQQR